MTGTSLEVVDGYLINDAGQKFTVRLQLTVHSLPGSDERAVSECRLFAGKIPDGTYTMEYFLHRRYREKVRVQLGMILAA